MANVRQVDNHHDYLSARVGAAGGRMYSVAPDDDMLYNIKDSSLYTHDDGTTVWDRTAAVTRRVNEYIDGEMTSRTSGVTVGSNIKNLRTGREVLLAQGEMIEYIMCHDGIREAYEGGTDFYRGWTPEHSTGEDNPYYRRLYNEVMVQEGEYLCVKTYADDDDIPWLTSEERNRIFKTHTIIDDLDLEALVDENLIFE